MSKILQHVGAALLLFAADPCFGQPLMPADAGSGGAATPDAALVLGEGKHFGTVVSSAMTLISILEAAPAAGRYSAIIGPLAAGPAAGIATASGSHVPGTSAFEMLA